MSQPPQTLGNISPTPWWQSPWARFLAVWLLFFCILALVYQPALKGGILWDDDAHVTKPELRSLHGLYRIWFEVGATRQYYPLLHSAFWLEHMIWGDNTLAYHLINILLHALAAALVAQILLKLKIPGAYLAAAVFALHPLQVESVAWITEQKNTLAAVFYLSALLLYLNFDERRKPALYLASLAFFIFAILSKTVTATLPGGILVILWWKRGGLSLRRDVLPVVPMFLVGAAAGLVTAWWELSINQCTGPDFTFSLLERILIAGRVVMFLAGKLFWPVTLIFSYPRWHIDASAWPQYLFPLAALVLLAVLWVIRRRTRAPLAAALFFGGTLFPVMGFFNLYTYRYSFVADHYQYLACLGLITLAAAGIVLLFQHWRVWGRWEGNVFLASFLLFLAYLSFHQSALYSDPITLYTRTIADNPDCWMAYNNIGVFLSRNGRVAEGAKFFQRSLQINPDNPDTHYNIGLKYMNDGNLVDAEREFREALRLRPTYIDARCCLATIFVRLNRTPEAVEEIRRAVADHPDDPGAHAFLGILLARSGNFPEAIDQFHISLRIDPDSDQVHFALASTLCSAGRLPEAVSEYQRVLAANPKLAAVHNSLGRVLLDSSRIPEAIAEFEQALRLKPDFPEARANLDEARGLRQSH